MAWLWIVTALWAFSFGLIKTELRGVDPTFLAAARLGLAALALAPFLRVRVLGGRESLVWILLGMVQFGGMYLFLFRAFDYAAGYEVALFTALTPLYVAILCDLVERRFRWPFWLGAAVAVAGVLVIQFQPGREWSWGIGFLLVQGANGCFAAGQVAYRYLLRRRPGRMDGDGFALAYLSAFALTFVLWALAGGEGALPATTRQWGVILYLGLIASGFGFYAWNRGAREVGSPGTLAVMNNGYIPLAVLVSVWVFGEEARLWPLLAGACLIVGAVGWTEWWHWRGPSKKS
jgi:drug/metabolite transporter (DMT)-like permease